LADAAGGIASAVSTQSFTARDGVPLVWRELGDGRPLILLHGLFSHAQTNWIKYGHAARLAEAGFRVIMPDLRAHGDSGAPHVAEAYPNDILSRDVADLVEFLSLTDYDLGGFSLGARTAIRAVVAGLTPRRLVVGGMGLQGLTGGSRRSDFFIGVLDKFDEAKRGDPEWLAIQFLKTTGTDRVAARHLLHTFTDTDPADLARVTMPTLVVCGAEDRDNGSAPDLAATLPNARYVEVPGSHMSSVTEAALGEAMAAFLAG
jgi:pimeloyl-ACP methyl ester carboxylesterase